MRVLVTGASSLLGRTLVARLVDRGDDVTSFQRRASGLGVTEHLGDVADKEAVAQAVVGVQAVIHVAGHVAMTGSWKQFEETNIRGTQNVIDAARAAGVGAPADPADPIAARGHYARSKAEAEMVALGANSSEMSVVALRPHLIWGPGDTQLVGRIVSRARAGRLAIVGSGAALIDTTYIDNAADALVAGLDRAPLLGGRVFVVTNGQPRPVVPYVAARVGGRVVEKIWDRRATDDEPPMTSFLAEQLGTAHWFDQRETREALQWEPAVSLAVGFQRLETWFASVQEDRPISP